MDSLYFTPLSTRMQGDSAKSLAVAGLGVRGSGGSLRDPNTSSVAGG